jgi:ABC-type antimicrobial peptide transport system permease subunit
VQATLAIAARVIAEASLSFLGLGQQPPAPSWGSMLNTAKNYVDNAPWMAIWPGCRSSCSCCRSTCSATACATRSTRGRY